MHIRNRVTRLLLALPLLLPATQFNYIKSTAQPSAVVDLEIDRLVDTPKRYYPPDYEAIKKINDDRVAAEEAQRAARRAEEAEAQRQAAEAARAAYSAPTLPTSNAKAFIYMHESGNRTDAINPSSGACGLGQALPCSKLPCSLSDYACQDAWFTKYMLSRYGTWENARAFWLANRWW